MALRLVTPSNRRYVRKRKVVKSGVPNSATWSPAYSFVGLSAHKFATLARSSASVRRKELARAARRLGGHVNIKKYVAAHYKYQAYCGTWARQGAHRLICARNPSKFVRSIISPSSSKSIPRVVTPKGDLSEYQDNIDLQASPTAQRLARKVGKQPKEEEPLIAVQAKIYVPLVDPKQKRLRVFFMEAAPEKNESHAALWEAAHVVIAIPDLIRGSSTCQALLHQKRVGTLSDPSNNIVYYPALATTQNRAKTIGIRDIVIYTKGLRESDFAKKQEYYEEVVALKADAFWVALNTFLIWIKCGDIHLGDKEGDDLAAYYVGNFLGAPDEYFAMLDI